MNFLGDIGIDLHLLIAQIINFAILLWFLTKFLYKPIIKRIEKDEAELEAAETGKKELEQERASFIKENSKLTRQAKNKSRKIIKEAEDIAKEIKLRAQKESEKEKIAIIKQIKLRLRDIEHEAKKKSKK